MKTKFIKVSVEERLPEPDKELFIINSEEEIFHGYLSSRKNWIIYGLKNAGDIQYFLEEVPDREEEMRLCLQNALNYLKNIEVHIPEYDKQKFITNKELIQKILNK